MALFTRFEGNLARLNWIKNEMETLYEEIPYIRGRNMTNTQIFKTIIGAFIVNRLVDFISIRESLLEDLRERNKEKIDECLMPFWQPIIQYKQPIIQLRNSFYAHMQDSAKPFERHSEEIGILSGFPGGFGDARFYASCVWKYTEYIEKNFKQEVKSAEKKYYMTKPPGFPHMRIPEANAENVLKQEEEKAVLNLKSNGFLV